MVLFGGAGDGPKARKSSKQSRPVKPSPQDDKPHTLCHYNVLAHSYTAAGGDNRPATIRRPQCCHAHLCSIPDDRDDSNTTTATHRHSLRAEQRSRNRASAFNTGSAILRWTHPSEQTGSIQSQDPGNPPCDYGEERRGESSGIETRYCAVSGYTNRRCQGWQCDGSYNNQGQQKGGNRSISPEFGVLSGPGEAKDRRRRI